MRILLLVIQYPPDTNPTGCLMAQVVGELRDCGHEVDVITTFPHYAQFRIWPAYRGKLAARERGAGGNVLRLWVYASGAKQRMLHRLLSYLSYNALAAAAALARRRYDVILAPNGSFFTGLAAALVGALRGTPFVYNVQDLYPEVPVRAGLLRNRHAIAALERTERLMYRLAAAVSVIAPSFRQNLLDKGVPPAKVHLIPNFVDTAFIRPLPKNNAFSRAHGIERRFVVSYAGNLGAVYDLETLLDAAARLAHLPEILFLIVGEGVQKAALAQRAQHERLPNVHFMPFQPVEQLPWLRAASDVQVALHRPGTSGFSLPSKIYEILASGRPLLASADAGSDVAALVERSGGGVCIAPGDAQQLVEAIKTLHGSAALRTTMGEHGRRYAEQHLSSHVVVRQYQQLFAALAPAARPSRRSALREKG